MISELKEVFGQLAATLAPVVAEFGKAFGGILATITSAIKPLLPLLKPLLTLFLLPAIVNLKILAAVIRFVADAVSWLVAKFTGFLNSPFVAWLKGVLIVAWDDVQQAVEWVLNAVQRLWDNLTAFLSEIGAFFQPISDFFVGLGNAITDFFTSVIDRIQRGIDWLVEQLRSVGEFFGLVENETAKRLNKTVATDSVQAAIKSAQPAKTLTPAAKNALIPSTSKSSGITDHIGSAKGDSVQQRNVVVNIGKLVERLEIHAATVQEGMRDIERIVTESIVKAVRDAEIITAN